MDAQRNMYAATNEITNMLQEGIKQGLRYGGKLKMQIGGPYDPTQSDPYSNTLPTATVTAPIGANWLPGATVTASRPIDEANRLQRSRGNKLLMDQR